MVFFGLAREARDHVLAYSAARNNSANAVHERQVLLAVVAPIHGLENARRTALHRQVNVLANVGVGRDGLQHVVLHVLRIAGREADSHLGYRIGHKVKQVRKVMGTGLRHGACLVEIFFESAPVPQVGIDVLTKQRNLLIAVRPKLHHLLEDGLRVSTALSTAGKGHHAEGAHVVASAGYAYKGRDSVASEAHRLNVVVGLFFAQKYVYRLASAVKLLEQVGQITVCIGAHDQVHKLLFFKKLFAHAFGHATQHANFELGLVGLERIKLIQSLAHGLLSLLANRAGIQEHQIGIFELVGGFVSPFLQNRGDNFAVREIHLASVGL